MTMGDGNDLSISEHQEAYMLTLWLNEVFVFHDFIIQKFLEEASRFYIIL